MSKRPKKRTKRYQGEDAKHLQSASNDQPIVRHYTAVDRGPVGEWWQGKKRIVKIVAIALAIIILVVWSIYELIVIAF